LVVYIIVSVMHGRTNITYKISKFELEHLLKLGIVKYRVPAAFVLYILQAMPNYQFAVQTCTICWWS